MRDTGRLQRVLFVDDDTGVLRGLRKSLRKKRKEWSMRFACGSKEALDFLDQEHADIIVSDMQMPEMDGAELLELVRKKHPHTNRLILSGYTREETIIKTVGPAHFYLAKPCKTEDIINAVDQLLKLSHYVGNEKLRDFSTSIKRLPSIPSIVKELMIELEKEDASIDKIGEIVGKDIALTAQILRLTNSAFFSLPVKATNPTQAVKLLGLETIRDVILCAGVVGVFRGSKEEAARIERLSSNCLMIGKLASAICKNWGLSEEVCGQASCAGVVSHLGSLLLQTANKEEYDKAMSLLENENLSICEAEEKIFGTDHKRLGAYMLGIWGFSYPIIEAVAHHHLSEEFKPTEKSPAVAVYIAQCISRGENWDTEKRKTLKSNLDWDKLTPIIEESEFESWLEIFERITR